MSASHKEMKKKIKKPDLFQLEVTNILDFIIKNKKQITMVVAPVVLIAVIGVIWQQLQMSQAESRREALAMIDKAFADENSAVEKQRAEIQKEITALRAEETKLKTNPKKGDELKKVTVKIDSLTKKSEGLKADHTKSTKDYAEYFAKYKDTSEGWLAGVKLSSEYIKEKKFKEAASVLEYVLSKSVSIDFYQKQVRLMYVSVLEELGDFDKASKEVALLLEQSDDKLKPRVLLRKGVLEVLSKNKAEAQKTFSELIEKFASSAEAQKAKSMKALWN